MVIEDNFNFSFTETLDVHGFTTDEMLDSTFYLRRASHAVGAIPGCFAFFLCQNSAAFGTFGDKFDRFAAIFTLFEVNFNYFRDYFTAFFHFNGVVVMQVKLADEIGIV